MSEKIVCEVCGGEGVVAITVAVCCERPTKTGECCNNPVPKDDVDQCRHCGGYGHYGWYPDPRLDDKEEK